MFWWVVAAAIVVGVILSIITQPRSPSFPLNARVAVSVLIEHPRDPNLFLVMKHTRGSWELPGGKLEPGETVRDNALREVKEETNLDIKLGGVIKLFSNFTDDGNTFVFMIFKGMPKCYGDLIDLKTGREHNHAHWASWKEIDRLSPKAPRFEALCRGYRDFPELTHFDVTQRDWYPGEKPTVGVMLKS